jgi:ATP-dependent DNA ligase
MGNLPPSRPNCQARRSALFAAVCKLGVEGVVAKSHSSLYRPSDRGWVKVKNPNYWRREHR